MNHAPKATAKQSVRLVTVTLGLAEVLESNFQWNPLVRMFGGSNQNKGVIQTDAN